MPSTHTAHTTHTVYLLYYNYGGIYTRNSWGAKYLSSLFFDAKKERKKNTVSFFLSFLFLLHWAVFVPSFSLFCFF